MVSVGEKVSDFVIGGICSGEWKLTLFGLGDVVVIVDLLSFAGVVDDQRDVLLVVEAHVRVADHVHGEFEFTGLRRGLELHLHGDHFERGSAVFLESGLVEGGEAERRDGDLALP